MVLQSESQDGYYVYPQNAFAELKNICSRLELVAAFTMQCDTVDHFIEKLQVNQTEITLMPHCLTIPVAESLQELARGNHSVRRRDYACFIRKEHLLLLWSQTADDLLDHAKDIERKLVDSV